MEGQVGDSDKGEDRDIRGCGSRGPGLQPSLEDCEFFRGWLGFLFGGHGRFSALENLEKEAGFASGFRKRGAIFAACVQSCKGFETEFAFLLLAAVTARAVVAEDGCNVGMKIRGTWCGEGEV